MSKARLVSPLCWPGGKRHLVRKLLPRIPPHRVYVEPFIGAGHLYWAKEPAEVEVINDLDPRLIKWYQDLKKRSRLDCDMTPSKEKFIQIRDKKGTLGFCDYLHLVKLSYGCKGGTYSAAKVKRCLESEDPSTCKVTMLTRNFDKYRKRLSRTRILKRDYRDILKKFDGPDTFFYLDPPYYDHPCYYVSCDVNPRQIADAVRTLKGKWLLSYNDHPDIRAAFKGYKIEKVSTQYSLDESSVGKQVFEVLISNY